MEEGTMNKIKALHFADLHLGVETPGRANPVALPDRALDFLRVLDEIVEAAIEEADLVMFAGDAYKTHRPSPVYQAELARRLRRLSEAKVPVVLLVGNHDTTSTIRRATSLTVFDVLDVPNVTVAVDETLYRLETKNGPVQVGTLPYPTQGRLLDVVPGGFEEINEAMLDRVSTRLSQMREKLEPGMPHVLLAHCAVEGATFGAERSVMLGREVVVPLSALEGWDYVALGHVHKHQEVSPNVVYSGSPERIDFGEEDEPKGFCAVELGDGEASWEFRHTSARPMQTVDLDLVGLAAPLSNARSHFDFARPDLEKSIVRVRVRIGEDQLGEVTEKNVAEMLEGAHHVASISFDVVGERRPRLTTTQATQMSDRELLAEFLSDQPDEVALMELADELL